MDLFKLDDELLISKLKEGVDTDECLSILTNRHSGIFYDITHRFLPNTPGDENGKEDFTENPELHIYDAVLNFDPSRGVKFSSYLGLRTRWNCLKHLKSNQRQQKYIATENVEHFAVEDNGGFKKELFEDVLQAVDKYADSQTKKIFDLRYFGGEGGKLMPWKKIAEEVSCPKSQCVKKHNMTIDKIKKEFKA